jgi:hypothetical protein
LAPSVPDATDTTEAETKEHAALSWKLIEWKVAYYKPEAVHPSRRKDYVIDDETYDAHERRYMTLCRKLGLPNTVVHKQYPEFPVEPQDRPMMEVDVERNSVKLVLNKLGSRK